MTNFRGNHLISRVDFPKMQKCRFANHVGICKWTDRCPWVFLLFFFLFFPHLLQQILGPWFFWITMVNWLEPKRLWMFFFPTEHGHVRETTTTMQEFPTIFLYFFWWISHQERSRSARGFPDRAVACCIMSDPTFFESLKFFEYVWAQFHVPSGYD